MSATIQLFDMVALMEDVPDRGLVVGQVGTVVEVLGPHVFEVEFSDNAGWTYAMLPFRSAQLMVLHHQPREAHAHDVISRVEPLFQED